MNCELTNKPVCFLTKYKGLLISVSEVIKEFESKEELNPQIERRLR